MNQKFKYRIECLILISEVHLHFPWSLAQPCASCKQTLRIWAAFLSLFPLLAGFGHHTGLSEWSWKCSLWISTACGDHWGMQTPWKGAGISQGIHSLLCTPWELPLHWARPHLPLGSLCAPMIPNSFPTTFTSQGLDWTLYSWELENETKHSLERILPFHSSSFDWEHCTAAASDPQILKFSKTQLSKAW